MIRAPSPPLLAPALLVALAWGGCVSASPPAGSEAAPARSTVDDPAPPDAAPQRPAEAAPTEPLALGGGDPRLARFLEACTGACERRQQTRAVGWQVIQAECARGCEADWAAPQVTTGAEAARAQGARVRVRGALPPRGEAGAEGSSLVLADGTRVRVRLVGSLLEGGAPGTGQVLVVGTLEREAEGFVLRNPTALVAE